MKTPVTVSEITSYKSPAFKGHCEEEDFQRYVYTECSMCEAVDHLMRTSVFWEVETASDGKKRVVLGSVNIQYPSEMFVDPSWVKFKRGVPRFVYALEHLWKRVVLAFKVLFGVKIYLGCGNDMSLETAKEYGLKLAQVAKEALGEEVTAQAEKATENIA